MGLKVNFWSLNTCVPSFLSFLLLFLFPGPLGLAPRSILCDKDHNTVTVSRLYFRRSIHAPVSGDLGLGLHTTGPVPSTH